MFIEEMFRRLARDEEARRGNILMKKERGYNGYLRNSKERKRDR